jgi:hypothetical protein
MEVADAHRMDSSAHQFFLATTVQRELGQRNWTRTAHGAALALLSRLFDVSSVGGVLADSFVIRAVGGESARLT